MMHAAISAIAAFLAVVRAIADDGTPYHYNTVTGASIWEHPRDQEYREMFDAKKKEAKAEAKARRADMVQKDTHWDGEKFVEQSDRLVSND